jgi:hypothetical protein
MHLVCVIMLYGIVILLGGTRMIAAGAALLFGIHPMTNETVVVAIWTNTTAYAFVFTSFFLFLFSLHSLKAQRNWQIPLSGSLVCAVFAVFTYEPAIVVYGLIAGYLWVWKYRGGPLPRTYAFALTSGVALELLTIFGLRHLIVTEAAPVNSISVALKDTAMYLLGLALPVDVILMNTLFGTPLPSQIHVTSETLAVGVAICVAIAALITALLRNARLRMRLGSTDWTTLTFLLAAIPFSLLPLLVFRGHPSEHGLYLPAAFYAALLSILLAQLTKTRALYILIVGCLAASFAAGTLVRNERVERCAAIAQKILTQLPLSRWRSGQWQIQLGTLPGAQLSEPYGIYNDWGIHTLEVDNGSTPGAESAIQLETGNEAVAVRVNPPGMPFKGCVKAHTCFWISAGGDVTEAPSQTAVGAHDPCRKKAGACRS